MRNDYTRTRLEMHTDLQGRTTTRLLVDGKDISDRIGGLSLHVHPGEPIKSEIILLIDEVQVSVGVVENIVNAVLPADMQENLAAYLRGELYDGDEPTENEPRTFG